MRIREFQPKDKEQVKELVYKILDNIFNSHPKENIFYKELKSNKDYSLFLVAETEGDEKKIIGTAGLKPETEETVILKRVYVDSNYRRRGIAQKLLDQCIGFARAKNYKKIIFSTYPVMNNIQKFLRKNGFKETDSKDPEQITTIKTL